jgi:hypothetical protein
MQKRPTGGGIKQVGDLFAKYQKILKPPQASVEKEFVVVVKELVGVTLQAEQVTYKVATRTIGLTAPGVIKTEIRFKQQQVLEELTRRLGEGNQPTAIV